MSFSFLADRQDLAVGSGDYMGLSLHLMVSLADRDDLAEGPGV